MADYSLYLLFPILLGDFVNSQQYIGLTAPSTIRYKTDKLTLTCTPQGAALSASIYSIALQKRESNGQITDVVKVMVFNGQIHTIWGSQHSTMQNLATIIKQSVTPSSTAGLQIEVPADDVRCTFEGEYRCEIGAVTSSGVSLDGESIAINISMSVSPISINPISNSPNKPDNIYNENTVVTLTCTGDVGNPAANLRWCILRSGRDPDFIGYPNATDTTQDTAIFNSASCQYRRTSRLTYNVSSSYSYTEFRCETGGTTTTCGHTSAIAANVTITKYTVSRIEDQVYQGTSNIVAIAGGVAGGFVCILLVIVILCYITHRRKNAADKSYETPQIIGISDGYEMPQNNTRIRDGYGMPQKNIGIPDGYEMPRNYIDLSDEYRGIDRRTEDHTYDYIDNYNSPSFPR